jgi:hypothetical protein
VRLAEILLDTDSAGQPFPERVTDLSCTSVGIGVPSKFGVMVADIVMAAKIAKNEKRTSFISKDGPEEIWRDSWHFLGYFRM